MPLRGGLVGKSGVPAATALVRPTVLWHPLRNFAHCNGATKWRPLSVIVILALLPNIEVRPKRPKADKTALAVWLRRIMSCGVGPIQSPDNALRARLSTLSRFARNLAPNLQNP